MTTQKSWWAPIWRGLVVDADGKHCRRMKNAIWLYLHFVLHADRRTGRLKRKCGTIAVEMGMPEATIRKWLDILRHHEYIETRNTGRCLEIAINRWRTFPQLADSNAQEDQVENTRLFKSEQSVRLHDRAKILTPEENSVYRPVPNDSTIKRKIKNDKAIDSQISFDSIASNGNAKRLALELCQRLDDQEGIAFYLSCAQSYPEPFLRQMASLALSIPQERIRESRGALFNYLVSRYASPIQSEHFNPS
jgi:hypothetical protein